MLDHGVDDVAVFEVEFFRGVIVLDFFSVVEEPHGLDVELHGVKINKVPPSCHNMIASASAVACVSLS